MSSSHIDPRMIGPIRWAMLRTIQVGGHLGATDAMIREAVRAEYLGVDTAVVRNELAYLEERKLVRVHRSEIEPWHATLRRYGRDVVDYQVPCDPGVSRPPRPQPAT